MDLKTKAIKSTVWYIGTRVWMQALSWGVTLILARILAPEDYGLFAMAFTVITFIELFQEFGLGVSIIQRRNLSKEQINAIFWLICGVTLVIATLVFFTSEFVAGFYQEPRLTWIVRMLSLTFLFNSLGVVPYSLLTKEIDFRHRSLAEAYGAVTYAGISLSAAYGGHGVWALVFGQLMKAAVRNLAMFVSSRWLPRFEVNLGGMKDILKFSLRMAGSSAMGSLCESLSNGIVGRLLGGYDLGLYSMATSLSKNNPLHKLSTGVINQLSLPIFSNLQHDPESLRKYFLQITRCLAVISLPMQVGLALIAHDVVLLLLSEKWLPIVELVQIFALAGVFHILTLPSGPLLTARGRADIMFRFTFVYSLVIIGAHLIGTRWGLKGVATAWAISFVPLRLFSLFLSTGEIELSTKAYCLNLFPAGLATAAMAITVMVSQSVISVRWVLLERLLTDVALGAGTYIIVLVLIDRDLVAQLRMMTREFLPVSKESQAL
jgi:teichuronic acid exporter